MKLQQLIHWLFVTENPTRYFPAWAVHLWYVFIAVTLIYFFAQEIPGLLGYKGMVPLTFVARCGPRIMWFIIGFLELWHFAFVTTLFKHHLLTK